MEEPKRDGKEEKEVQKHEEKSFEEKTRSDPVGTFAWALTLIWAGIVLLLYNMDQLSILTDFVEKLNLPSSEYPINLPFVDEAAWQVFFLGAAFIVVIEIIIRLLFPVHRKSIVGNIIWAGILFGLALGNWEIVLPIAIIAAGVIILLGRLTPRR